MLYHGLPVFKMASWGLNPQFSEIPKNRWVAMPGATGTSDGLHLSHMVTIGETSLARYGSLEDSTPYLV
jgi:hypothetical protein